jgi:hypothetical protein
LYNDAPPTIARPTSLRQAAASARLPIHAVACRTFIALSIVASCAGPDNQPLQQSAQCPPPIVRPQGTARAATQEEIAAAFVGKTVNFSDGGVGHYGPDGRYTFTFSDFWNNDKSTGRYSIRPSTLCIKFDDGGSRCDTIYVDNGEYTLVNKDDKSFAFQFR